MKTINTHPLATLAVALLFTPAAWGGIIAINGDIPTTMNAGGSEINPAEYILGFGGEYDRTFGSNITVGSDGDWNRLIIQNGSEMSTGGGAGSAVRISSTAAATNNRITLTGAGSSLDAGSNFIVGEGGEGEVRVEAGASLSAFSNYLGYYTGSQGTAFVSGAGSTWSHESGGSLFIGYNGMGNLQVQAGGSVSSTNTRLGSQSGSQGSATVTGVGSVMTSSGLDVGYLGTGELLVEAGGNLSTTSSVIGSAGQGTVTVTGEGSIWVNEGILAIGDSSGNNLTVADGALVTANGSVSISRYDGTDNYLRLDGGFFAWEGDNMSSVETLTIAGEILVWDTVNEEWINANSTLGETLFEYAYFETDQEAFDFTGYNDLGGYTILTTSAIPEPAHFGMIAGFLGLLLAARRKRA